MEPAADPPSNPDTGALPTRSPGPPTAAGPPVVPAPPDHTPVVPAPPDHTPVDPTPDEPAPAVDPTPHEPAPAVDPPPHEPAAPVDPAPATPVAEPPSVSRNPTRRDFMLAAVVAVVLMGGLLIVTTRPWSSLSAADPETSTACRSGVVQAELTASDTIEGNVHIRLSTRLDVPVTITELFMRSPALGPDYKSVVNPPVPTVISAGHPFDWDVLLATPVTGTIIGIHKEPWGVNAIHASWTAADGTRCDRVD